MLQLGETELIRNEQDGRAISLFSTSRSREKWPTVVATLVPVACLVVEIIQRCVFTLADPL